MLGSGIGRNLAVGLEDANWRGRAAEFATVRRSMRRFATWTTGHRKTVIISWIVALIGIGTIAGSAGSEFTEEFNLPSSDSVEALHLLEDRFPQQAGESATIVFKAPEGISSEPV